MHDHIQPIVLVGGRARRFGRDKLRETIARSPDEWLVDRPIAAMRAVFGPRVAAVGECDPEVAARFDLAINDDHPGIGPIGGVLSALRHSGTDVFVLAGDLPDIRPDDIQTILAAVEHAPEALAIVADATGPQPCIALYRKGARIHLEDVLARGELALHAAIPKASTILVPIPVEHALNINTPRDLSESTKTSRNIS